MDEGVHAGWVYSRWSSGTYGSLDRMRLELRDPPNPLSSSLCLLGLKTSVILLYQGSHLEWRGLVAWLIFGRLVYGILSGVRLAWEQNSRVCG